MQQSSIYSHVEKNLTIESGLNIAYRVWGNEDGKKKILAIHGWVDNLGTWDLFVPELFNATKEENFENEVEFIAIDLPGHGHSEHYPCKLMRYRFVDWITIVFEFIEKLGWKKYSLVGHSMGAGITSMCAAIRPQEVELLVNIEGFGPWTESDDESANLVSKFRESLDKFHGAANRPPKLYLSVDDAVDRLLQNNPTLKRTSAECLVNRGIKKVISSNNENNNSGEEKAHFEFRHDPRLLVRDQIRSFTHRQVPHFLKEIACPMLVITGDNGIPTVKKFVNERKEYVNNFTHVDVIGTHHVHLDYPENVIPPFINFVIPIFFPKNK